MTEYFNYLSNHWIIGGSLSWFALMFGFMTIYAITQLVYKLARALLRSLNIWFRGWPPAHLNVDGEVIKKRENKVEVINGRPL